MVWQNDEKNSSVFHENVRYETSLPGHCKSCTTRAVPLLARRKSTDTNPLFPDSNRTSITANDSRYFCANRAVESSRVGIEAAENRERNPWNFNERKDRLWRCFSLLQATRSNATIRRLLSRCSCNQRRNKIPWQVEFIECSRNNVELLYERYFLTFTKCH